ncbi:TPA: hypothetical protein P5S08_002458 [Salmonella enterica subsp. enterica serovar Concord]|nr:hypothetical protein [Salmonella enterica subsp. enterica serovar Concord]
MKSKMKSKQSLLSLLVALAMAPVMVAEAAGDSDDNNTPLNFNYTRPSTLSLVPQISLQTRGCRSLVDPMKINIRFQNGMDVSGLKVNVKVKGAAASRSFTLYSPDAATLSRQRSNDNTGIDGGFLVPWGVDMQGEASGKGHYTTPGAKYWYTYHKPFCFKDGFSLVGAQAWPTDAYNSAGLIPIFQIPSLTSDPSYTWDPGYITNKYGKDVGNYGDCRALTGYKDIETGDKYSNQSDRDAAVFDRYWPNYDEKPYYVPNRPAGMVFWRERISVSQADESIRNPKEEDVKVNINSVHQDTPEVSWDLPMPIAAGIVQHNYDSKILDKGEFDLTLANRNISELILTVTDKANKSSVFTWKRNIGSSGKPDNTLQFEASSNGDPLLKPGVIEDGSDAYQTSNPKTSFYDDGVKQDYFRGTLVRKGLLNQYYTEFVNTKTPLSLPPDSKGGFNVVNTDSLTITLGQNNGEYNATIYGQPLMFSPLKAADGTVLSTAKQVRDACY